MKNAYIHVRVDESDKSNAERILKNVGLDLSSAITAFLKKIQAVGGIPFELTNEDLIIENVKATMAMEGMYLTDEEVTTLKRYRGDGSKHDKEILNSIIAKYKED